MHRIDEKNMFKIGGIIGVFLAVSSFLIFLVVFVLYSKVSSYEKII
jgi:hypothetical protein